MSLIKYTGYKTVDNTQAGYIRYNGSYYFHSVVVRFQRKKAELTKRQFNILHLVKLVETDNEYFNNYFMERGEQELDYVIFPGNRSVYLVYLETQFIIDVVTEQIKSNRENK